MNRGGFIKVTWLETPYVREMLGDFLADKGGATRERYESSLKGFIEFCCGRWKCSPNEINFASCTEIYIPSAQEEIVIRDQIRSDVIESYLNTISSPWTRRIAQRVLGRFFRYLLNAGVIRTNPVSDCIYPKRIRNIPGLTVHEVEILIGEIKRYEEPYRAAFLLQLSSGLRFGEVRALRQDDVRRTDKGWEVAICREALKGGKPWILPLPEIGGIMQSLMLWRQLQPESEYLFAINGKPLNYHTYLERLQKVARRAGVNNLVGTHDLRRAFSTLVDRHVKNPDVLVVAMRHGTDQARSYKVTRKYVREPEWDEITRCVASLPAVRLADSLAAVWLRKQQLLNP